MRLKKKNFLEDFSWKKLNKKFSPKIINKKIGMIHLAKKIFCSKLRIHFKTKKENFFSFLKIKNFEMDEF